jgi:hypothetical protein
MLSRPVEFARQWRYQEHHARRMLGYRPNLWWPRTFNEKLIRRKLQRPPKVWSQMADKFAARQIASQRAGNDVLVPLHGVFTDVDALRLPSNCAVKATHGSGWNVFVRDGSPSHAEVAELCRAWLSQTYGTGTREPWYAGVTPRVLVEQLLVDDTYGVPLDFKCFAFHGRVEFIQVDAGRFTRHTRTFYDRDWQRQAWGLIYPPAPDTPRPSRLDELIALAETLAAGMDFIRIDLYCVNDRDLYFGEFTLAPEAGWGRFWPNRGADRMLGRLW